MKKILFVLLCTAFVSINIKAQQMPFLQWQKSFGGTSDDVANSIQQTKDGGYVIAGLSHSNNGDVTNNHGNSDYWIVKTDATGNIQWQKSFGGSENDVANSIQQTTDGGYIIAGNSSSSDGDVTGNHGGNDYWIVKIDAFGNIQWQKAYGGSYSDDATSIQQTVDGGYIIAGFSYSNNGDVTGNHGEADYWIVKLDASNNIEWQKSLGGSNYEELYSIKQTTDGGYIVAGLAFSNDGDVTKHHGNIFYQDFWIVKLNATGNIQWQKSLGGSDVDIARSVQQTADGGYIIAGNSYSNDGDVTGNHGISDYWIVKTDALGNIQWQKSFGGPHYDFAVCSRQTADRGYIVAGTSELMKDVGNHGNRDYWIVKTDSLGNIQWQKSPGGSNFDELYDVIQTTDESYIATGYSSSNNGNVTGNHGNADIWVAKLSPENLGTNISFYSYQIARTCYPANAISCTMKNNTKAVVVKLYRYGVLYDSALNVADHTGFTNLPCGDYYATATDENGNISFSKEVQIVPTPINTATTNITSTSAQFNWTGFNCADEYLIQFHKQGDIEWDKKAPGDVSNFVLYRLAPSTNYVWRVASEKRVNGIKATGRFSDSLTFATAASVNATNAANIKAVNNNSVQLIVSPNPAKNYFTINLKGDNQQKINAMLYNVNGKTAWTSGLINANTLNGKQVNASQFAKGVYYLKLVSEQGELISTIKIVVAN